MAEAASRIFHTSLLQPFSPLTCKAYRPRFRFTPCSSLSPTTATTTVVCSASATNSAAAKTSESQRIPWGCDVDSLENASALQRWLSDSGLPPQKMEIQRVDVGERGLVALKNIRKGEKLLFVPPSLVITADSVRLPRHSFGFENKFRRRASEASKYSEG